MAFTKGATVRIAGYFKRNAVYTDPTTVTLKVKDPSGNISTYTYAAGEITKESTGIYYKDVVLDESWTWKARYETTGPVETAVEIEMQVEVSEF